MAQSGSLRRLLSNRTVVLVGLTSLLTDISSEMVYPLLPVFLTGVLGASPAILGVIEGIVECVASLLKVWSGAISDALGRRRGLAAGGYAASVAGKAILMLAGAWPVVLGARTLDRLGKGVRGAPRDALLADAVPATDRGAAFGLHRALDTLGAVAGVVIAWLVIAPREAIGADTVPTELSVSGDTVRTVIAWSLIPAALGVLAILLVREAPDQRPTRKPPVSLRGAWTVAPRPLRLFLVIAAIFALGNASNQFVLLLAGRERGFSISDVLLLYLVYNLTYAAAAYPAGRASDVLGRRAVLVAGYALYGLTYLGFALLPGQGAMWVLMAVYGVFAALTEGVEKALVADLAPRERRGGLLGLHATIVGLGLLPASALAGLVWTHWGAPAAFLIGAATGAVAAALMLGMPRNGGAQLPP